MMLIACLSEDDYVSLGKLSAIMRLLCFCGGEIGNLVDNLQKSCPG